MGAHGLESDKTSFVSILLDGALALDAGALASSLSLSQQGKLKAILLTHSHADHTMGLASLSMHAFLIGATVEVYVTKDTVEALTTHVFNGTIHPEFTKMPSPEKPALRFHLLETYKPQAINGYTILSFPFLSITLFPQWVIKLPSRMGRAYCTVVIQDQDYPHTGNISIPTCSSLIAGAQTGGLPRHLR